MRPRRHFPAHSPGRSTAPLAEGYCSMLVQLPPSFDRPLDGRYLVEHQVGAGASGVVYRAIDLVEQRPVALKVLNGLSEGFENPAVREAMLLSDVEHPGIVRIWEAGMLSDLGHPFLSMEWLDGQDLATHQRNAPLGVREATAMGVMLANALACAHERGLIHRDVKPANILLRRRGAFETIVPELEFEPVLIDFGVAARAGHLEMAGTPAYMSPEQARGDNIIDHRSDLYSLGATLFELIVGRPPHQGASAIATLARLATTPAPRMSVYRSGLPPGLDEAVDRLLQTDPQCRTKTAREAARQLASSLHEEVLDPYLKEEASSRLDTAGNRLVTTIVAVGFPEQARRTEAIRVLREAGALAVPLGQEALVAHLGVERATGGEAQVALRMGRRLAQQGSAVGVASGRARLEPGARGHVHPVGDVVDRAASLARAAHANQTISDTTTSELGRGRFDFRVRADGSAIVGDRIARPTGDRTGGAPFVGREPELAQIVAAFDRAQSERESLVVSVTGPPGIGKTRLQKETIARLASRSEGPRIVVRRSDAYAQRHILGTAADILRGLIGLRKGALLDEAEAALVEHLGPQTLSELSRDQRRLLAHLLGDDRIPGDADAKASRDALWIAMTDLVLRVLSDESLVLVMEDLQWGDAESIAWLDHVLGRSSPNPLVLIACVRPEFWQPEGARFSQRSHIRIDLRPISQKAVRAIAQAVLGESAEDDIVDDIVARAGGSPLFAEELARLAATGRLTENAPTIEAAIQASLDSLDDASRDAVLRLSVFGQSCWEAGLSALDDPPQQANLFSRLAGQEILVQQSSSRFPDTPEYMFKHALVRDVAYASLSPSHRQAMHAAAGRWLAGMGEDAATVAGHLELGQRPEDAAEFWARAAKRALQANALSDAVNLAEKALAYATNKKDAFLWASYLDEAWSRLDPRAADRESAVSAMENAAEDEPSEVIARAARARFEDARGSGGDVATTLSDIRARAEHLGLIEVVARCSATLASRAAYSGDFDTAEREAARLLGSQLSEVPAAPVDAYQALAIVRQAKGQVSSALDARKLAAESARRVGLKEREAMLTTNVGFALSTIGARQEARSALERGLLLAENIGSPGALRHAQMNLLGWAGLYGNDRRLEGYLSETRAEADAAATGFWTSPDRSNLGILFYRGVELLRLSQEQAHARAVLLLRLAADSYRELGHNDVLPVALGNLAEAERLCGNVLEAARVGGEAAELLERGAPSLLNEAPVFLTLHKARLALGDEAGAVSALLASIPLLKRRLDGLVGSSYARGFLTELPHNAELISAADAAGVLPESIHRLLTRDTNV